MALPGLVWQRCGQVRLPVLGPHGPSLLLQLRIS